MSENGAILNLADLGSLLAERDLYGSGSDVAKPRALTVYFEVSYAIDPRIEPPSSSHADAR